MGTKGIFATQARCNESGKVDHCMMLALLWLEVALVEAMKDGVRHEEHQPQEQDRVRVNESSGWRPNASQLMAGSSCREGRRERWFILVAAMVVACPGN